MQLFYKPVCAALALAAMPLFNSLAQTVEKLSNNQFEFVEGPVWDDADVIYFSDIPASKVVSYRLSTGAFSDAFTNTNRPNGLMFNSNFDLLVCEGGVGAITRRTTSGNILETVVNSFAGTRFNGPNDLCVDKKGGLYFTDPDFESSSQQENRLYYRNSVGAVSIVDNFMKGKPNGVIISPNGQQLYVNNTFSKQVFRYDINQGNGALSNRIVFGEIPDNAENTGADGMTMDTNGRLYVTAKGAVHVFDGSRLAPVQTVVIPEFATNCTFGGMNKDILFVTAGKNLYKVTGLNATGVHHPFDLPKINVPPSDANITVEAEMFTETGGAFEGFNRYTTADGVGAIDFNQTGDWVEYQVDIPKDQNYEVTYYIATPVDMGAIELFVNGVSQLKDNVRNNGNWNNFVPLKASKEIFLAAGQYTIRLMGAGTNPGKWEWNLDRFSLSSTTAVRSASQNKEALFISSGPVSIKGLLEATASEYTVVDMNGKPVLSGHINDASGEVEGIERLGKGIYLMKVLTTEGKNDIIKIIKK